MEVLAQSQFCYRSRGSLGSSLDEFGSRTISVIKTMGAPVTKAARIPIAGPEADAVKV